MIAVAGFAMTFDVRESRALGDAPWCAVIEIGNGEVYWHTQYRTAEACSPNVLAGNRGFRKVNPYGSGPNAPTTVARLRHSKRNVRSD